MIMRGWEIVQTNEGHMAKEFTRGKDGMGERFNKYTGNEITGPLENIRQTLLVDMKLEQVHLSNPPEGVLEIWW